MFGLATKMLCAERAKLTEKPMVSVIFVGETLMKWD